MSAGKSLSVVPLNDDGIVEVKPGGLQRSQSMKAAANHYKEHKWKYIACKVAIALAIGLGVGLGIAAVVLKSKGKSLAQQRSAIIAGQAGTTVPVVSAIPSKEKQSSRRLLVEKKKNNIRRG